MIAGANGAGKTTFAHHLLPTLYPDAAFLNGDEVQTEASAFAHPVAAGREMLRRLGEAERGGHSVPESDVRRRYHRGLELFEQVYKPLVDEWYHWFSNEEGIRLGQQAKR